MTKEQFEAHVRAEAEKRYPAPSMLDYGEVRLWKFDHGISIARLQSYIATRMEHEWKLVELLWRFVDITKPNNGAWCDTFDRFPVHLKLDAAEYDRLHDAHIDATAALSPYTTKPIEQ